MPLRPGAKADTSPRPSRAAQRQAGRRPELGRAPSPHPHPHRPGPLALVARPRPARANLTLSRSSGCVQQAAPHEASPPKYQRDTRASAAMARAADAQERRLPAPVRAAQTPAQAQAPIGPRPQSRTPARVAVRSEFKAPFATRAPRSQCARAALGAGPLLGAGPPRPRLEPGGGRAPRLKAAALGLASGKGSTEPPPRVPQAAGEGRGTGAAARTPGSLLSGLLHSPREPGVLPPPCSGFPRATPTPGAGLRRSRLRSGLGARPVPATPGARPPANTPPQPRP